MDVQYVTQKCVQIADCMSRLIDIKTGRDDSNLNLQIADVTVTESIDWNQIKKVNMNDPTMVRLDQIIQKVDLKQVENYMMTSRPIFPTDMHYI